MLEAIGFGILGLWSALFAHPTQQTETLQLVSWHEAKIFEIPTEEFDPVVQNLVDRYLDNLARQGIKRDRQSVWLQSDWTELANTQGTKPVSAASLTKIATTLAALEKLEVDYQFITKISHTGSIEAGVLQGDLIVEGGGDPFFVWEEAIALSNALNQLGIREITGNLLISDRFYMNYESEPMVAGKLLERALEPELWTVEIKEQFKTLPLTTPRPQLKIAGEVKTIKYLPDKPKLLILHKSLPLVEILQQMNIYSNNKIAQILAESVGGAAAVADSAIAKTGVDPSEIQLINGSGLGVENRISPRAATRMLMAIDELLQPHQLEVSAIFPVGGLDNVGTLKDRQLPQGIAVKTGTLDRVSALAGVIPLENDRRIWFAIVNHGWQIPQFRQEQDKLLQSLASHWQLTSQDRGRLSRSNRVYLGDPDRNQIRVQVP